MVILGYQGIGKSTYCASSEKKVIDLESSIFRYDNGDRPNDWYKIYAKLALRLSSEGFIVFTSTHKEVRDAIKDYNKYLYDNKEIIIAICPALHLKDLWVKRLSNRYDAHHTTKNYNAYINAALNYKENIRAIAVDIEKTYYINDIDFDCFDYFDHIIESFI